MSLGWTFLVPGSKSRSSRYQGFHGGNTILILPDQFRLSQGSNPEKGEPQDKRGVWTDMDKQSTIRSIRSSYKIDQVENGWTVSTGDGNMFVFSDSRELAEWFCMIVGVSMEDKKAKEDPLEQEIRKLVKNYNLVAEDVDKHFLMATARN